MADEQRHVLDAAEVLVGITGADQPRFADETAALLRRRLMAVTLIMSSVLTFAFVGNLFLSEVPLWGVRAIVLSIFVSSFLILRSNLTLKLYQLRLFETANFGALTFHLLLMMYVRIWNFAAAGDSTSAVAAKHLFLSAFCIMILTYGIFMPNAWKRATLVLLPLASLPYIVLAILNWQVPVAASALKSSNMITPVPLPFVATLVAVFGTRIINSVRRKEFRARQLGQYHLKQELGVGSMGVVYEAEHRLLKRPCAIKLIRSENEADAKAIARFEQEVRATAKLSHWNTVDIFDYGHTEDGTFYYVMELLPGLSLDDLVKRHGPMPPERAVHFLTQTCRALREAHEIGLIHRDIKPANIVAACRGGIHDVAKLLDFGLVRESVGDLEGGHVSSTGKGFSGSPAYIAPEQAKNYDRTDARGDIYALGAVGYFLLTGRPPFTGKNPFEVLVAHQSRQVVPPSKISSNVPADLEHVLLQCLEKDPDRRIQTAEALEHALTECSCSHAWSDEKAATWWATHEPGGDRVACD